MKVLIFGEHKNEIEPLVKSFDFEITESKPDFVISYGGDGTLIRAEHYFPGLPKIILNSGKICKKCSKLNNEEILKKIANNDYGLEELLKLEAKAEDKILCAINDIIIHNQDARHAVRYHLLLNNKLIGNEIIGDGIVIATPFGSTAYYRSITDSFFEVGIGVAFNNSTEQADHMVVRDDSEIKIQIIRGPAVVYADNQKECIELNEGAEALVRRSSQTAKVIKLK